jgi:hypothetical protein
MALMALLIVNIKIFDVYTSSGASAVISKKDFKEN